MKIIKTFISYDNSKEYKKDEVQKLINSQSNMKDISLDYAIDSEDNEYIRRTIRDNYITDATVLVVLVTKDTQGRKFIDWEIAAAMYNGEKRKDGKRNDICGIVIVDYFTNNIKSKYKEIKDKYVRYESNVKWINLSDKETRKRYSYIPQRLLSSIILGASIQIIPSNYIYELLPKAIEIAHRDRLENIGKYIYNDLRKNNSSRNY